MLDPSMISALSEEDHRVVRFDQECILIPESLKGKRAIIATKSYHLPLWRRRTVSTGSEDLTSFEAESSSPTLKVTLPSFKTKSARSPSRGRLSDKPLSPCLVHRDPSSPVLPPPRRRFARSPSLPLPAEHLVKHETIPLRACCENCYSVTEESLREGKLWQEKFSRGAQRRRSSSASSDDFSMSPSSPPTIGFTAVTSSRQTGVITSRFQTALSITVDEVDKRRKSLELIPPSEPSPVSPSPIALAKSSPIEEEDEEQLFPLPSPRRTPTGSPAGSAEASPLPSPNASRIGISGPESSHDSLTNSGSGSEEGVIPKSISRRARCEKGLLMPEVPERVPTPPSPTNPRPTVSIPSSPVSSPSPSPIVHTRSATSPPAHSQPKDIPSPIHARSSSQLSSSPTKRRLAQFSPTALFKEALKGVSAMSGSNFST